MFDDLVELRERALSYSLIENLDEANPELYDLADTVFTITDGILADIIKEQGDIIWATREEVLESNAVSRKYKGGI